MTRRNGCTIYVGNLPGDIREREVDDLFYKVSGWLDRVPSFRPYIQGFSSNAR